MTAAPASHLILIARGDPADQSADKFRRIRQAVTGASILLVAPALPLPGERWIVDLDARASQARSRLQRWIAALADHASTIEAEIGDADPRAAVGDARRERPAAPVIDAPPAEYERTAEPSRLMRLAERYDLMTTPVAAGS